MVSFDVTEKLLLRLNLEDLLRCKSICKSWYSLISSHSFAKIHLKCISEKQDTNYKQHIQSSNSFIIQGSSNGLVCVSKLFWKDRNKIWLTNPSTGEFRKLQKPPIVLGEYDTKRYGFGYDSSTDDYKLVMVVHQPRHGRRVQILSLKSNVWKLFGHVNYGFVDSTPGIFFNGSLHWFGCNDFHKHVIVRFDLAKEEFREIPTPVEEDTRYSESFRIRKFRRTLGILEGHLCVIHTYNDSLLRRPDIWVMKTYNVKESWELLPTDCEMKDRVHYVIEDKRLLQRTPPYLCCDSREKHISDPIFLQTLVSPYVNDNERPSFAKNNKRTVESVRGKRKRKRLM